MPKGPQKTDQALSLSSHPCTPRLVDREVLQGLKQGTEIQVGDPYASHPDVSRRENFR